MSNQTLELSLETEDFDKLLLNYLNFELGLKDKWTRRTIRAMLREIKKNSKRLKKVELDARKLSFMHKMDQIAS